jgi:hypothetical protein
VQPTNQLCNTSWIKISTETSTKQHRLCQPNQAQVGLVLRPPAWPRCEGIQSRPLCSYGQLLASHGAPSEPQSDPEYTRLPLSARGRGRNLAQPLAWRGGDRLLPVPRAPWSAKDATAPAAFCGMSFLWVLAGCFLWHEFLMGYASQRRRSSRGQ